MLDTVFAHTVTTVVDEVLTKHIWDSREGYCSCGVRDLKRGHEFTSHVGSVVTQRLAPLGPVLATPEDLETFRSAWHAADAEGRAGERVLDGLTAVQARRLMQITGTHLEDEDEPDGAPCCPDPQCSGNPCTFPGYSPNH